MIALRPTMGLYEPTSALGPPPALAERLTLRQCEVAILVANGHGDKAIAEELDLSPKTIPTYVKRIAKRLQLERDCNLRIQITRVVVFAYAAWEDAA